MTIAEEQAIRIVVEHLISRINSADVREGWLAGAFQTSSDPVWSIRVPELGRHVGASRYIVISKKTGEVLADQQCGD